ncbi:hypothetical protein SADUNF_Sadunf06G0027600 [Salix dunnii]|uniref:Uncharacterized protein n=1 Tax=Salix dunnii TaxID=1413687 RepID=A0A835K558_9ROSI|nr:hypothetical protein SADUNF_Sadunf06G0027600 [Salix dunnii]
MEAKIREVFESVGSFFTGGDHIPWCDRDIINETFLIKSCKSSKFARLKGCEREVAEAAEGDSEELKRDTIMRLSWALVHSKQSEDVQRGIAMLEDGVIGIGITATAVGLIAGGIAAALARKK